MTSAIEAHTKAPSVLVIGSGGYVGRCIVGSAPDDGARVIPTARPGSRTVPGATPLPHAAALDELLQTEDVDQIVMLPQLTEDSVDWILDRIDGPRWLVFSSAQLGSAVGAPGTEAALARERLAVERGAVVIRPTMIYGRGGDANISRIVRQMRRLRVPVEIGDGSALVQPVHVDDVVELVHAHRRTAARAGVYEVGGPEQIPTHELTVMIAEVLGLRTPSLRVPESLVHRAASLAPLVRLRPDQFSRLLEDKVVDDTMTRTAFDWAPAPLAHRIEQAVGEALAAESS